MPRTTRFMCWAAALAVLSAVATPGSAIVLIDDSFTAAEGYNDGQLVFQDPDGSGNGIWLGQFFPDTGNSSVDTITETVNVVTGPAGGGGDAFLRNLWSLGATGTPAGGSSTEIGSGFTQGDKIKIDFEYQFTLPGTNQNSAMFFTGVRDCFATCGFDATPAAGIKAAYNPFAAGAVKVFTHPVRAGFLGADNPFALFLDVADIGLANVGLDSDPLLPVDLVSDNLLFSYEAELTDELSDTWTATSLVVTNLDTTNVVADASVDNPMALESFVWNATGVDDPFTDAREDGLAKHTTAPGSEMYYTARWTDDPVLGGSASSGGVRFEYLPIGGDAVPGDANGDGNVDLLDLDILGMNFGQMTMNGASDGDFNDDGNVDLLDLDILGMNFGFMSPSASVPEPTAAWLAVLVLTAAGLSRRAGS